MEIKQILKTKNNNGAALLYTMMFLMLMSVIIVSFSLVSVNMYKSTAVSASKEQSFLFAKTIGQVFALQLSDDIDATSIVSYLETNLQSAPTVRGTAKLSFDPTDQSISSALNSALKGTNLTKEDLSRINIPDAQLKFYFKVTCAKCGAHLEDLPKENNEYYCQSPTCKGKKVSNKIFNKKYLYLDVTVSYNGATEVVTTVFTYLDQDDLSDTMYDLFSVYNIYSTYPSEMEFTFTGDLDSDSISPNVYLYNGVDSETEGFGEVSSDRYTLRANVKANLTSTGDVEITSQSGSTLSVMGNITSYGSMILSRIQTSTMYMKGNLTVQPTATVKGNIYARNNVTVNGNGGSAYSVDGTIYAMGNVVISGANVGKIVGGPACNVTLLSNATCTEISTGGNVKIENSKVTGSVTCDGNLEVTNSTITGKAYAKGDCSLSLTSSSRQTVIGAQSIGNVSKTYLSSTALQVGGNIMFRNITTTSNLAVNGGVIIGGSIKYPQTIYGESIIAGGLNVKGFIKEKILGYDCNVCYLVGLNVYGGVNLESYTDRACIPLFGKSNTTAPSVSAKISGLIKVNGNLLLGDYFRELSNSETSDNQGASFDFRGEVSKYINLFGATIDRIQTQAIGSNSTNPTQVFISNGVISGGIYANQVVLSKITVAESAKINASGSTGCVIAVDKTILNGQIVARTLFSLHKGSVLNGTAEGFVHVYGFDNPDEPIHGTAYIDGEVYGELVVGTSLNSGVITIRQNALLGGNDYDGAIYINGDLNVKEHSLANITNSPEPNAPRLRTQNNNGNKIYLSNGTAHLNGWVYDLYIKDGDVDMMTEVAGYCGKPYIKGTTYVETAFVFIGKDGLKDSEGATYTNDNVIVYVYENTPVLGDLTISGTLVLKRGVTLSCKSLKVNRILCDYDGQMLTATNVDLIKTELTNLVKNYDFNNTTIKGLNVSGDTQINQMASGTITISDSTFGGWVKLKNATGSVVFKNSSITCTSLTTYANNNDKYKGCLDVSGANLSIIDSYIGGTSSRSYVDPDSTNNEGCVFCKILEMDGGAIYGTAYTTYAETLKSNAKIVGGLHMSTTTAKSLSWSDVYIDNFIYGPNVELSIDSGVLCGLTANSSNQPANLESNAHFVYLKELQMFGRAVLAQYTTVYIKNGVNSTLSGLNIGNIYAKTKNLNIFKSSSLSTVSVKGFVYCEGNLTYDYSVTPSAGKGLYALNSDVVITNNKFSAITGGGVTLPNYTGDVTLSAVTGNIIATKLNSLTLTGSVYGDIHTSSLKVENSTSAYLEGNILVDNTMKVESTSYQLTIGKNDFSNIKTLKVAKGLYIYSSSRTVSVYSFVRCGMLAVNFKKGTEDIAVTDKSISPSVYTSATSATNTNKYVNFYENVYVDLIDSNSGGNAYISNAQFMGKSANKYHGATLYTARSVLAVRSNFYGAGYESKTKHAYTTSLGAYNTNNSQYYTTNFGSIVAWLGTSSTTTLKSSYAYGIYLDKVYCYSNITQLESSLSSEINNNSELGEYYNADSGNDLEKRNYTKYYSFAGNLVLSNSKIRGIKYSKDNDPLAYTLLDVKGTLNIRSSIIGEDFSEYMYDDYNDNGQKDSESISRAHNQRSIKGIYVGSNMTIDASSTVYINIYVKGKLTNAGKIILQKLHTHLWDAFGFWAGKRSYSHYCGGEVQVGSYTNTGYNSIEQMGTGSSRTSNGEYSDKHNVEAASYSFCTANKDAFKIGSTISTCPLSLNRTTTINTAKSFVTDTRTPSSTTTSTLTINKKAENPILGLEWDSTESLVGKIKEPKYTIQISFVANVPNLNLTFNKTTMPTDRLDTSNQTYWYPQAIPLRWYLPTQTTAGDNVALNGQSTNTMTVQEVHINEGVFSNKSTSDYLGLRYANKDDAYYYRVSSKNINDVLSDANGKDMMVLTRTSFFNLFANKKKRPVGLVFFNSGIVPSDIFAYKTPYRDFEGEENAKDEEGRFYWGDNGNTENDVIWTFFACEDPKNPYTSKAKDLHIILPKNTKLVWQKDKDSCVSIIGNGRVFLYLQDNTDIKIIGNGFTHALHDFSQKIPGVTEIENFFKQWSNGDATFNIFGGVRYVAVQSSSSNDIYAKTYYKNGNKDIVMDKAALELANSRSDISVQLQPRMYIIGAGGNIRFEVQDFQTAAYVYMPSGYSYGNKNARNKFVISARDDGYNGENRWDVYGIYVCDNFEYANSTGAKVRYFKTSPDLSVTSFMRTYFSGGSASSTSKASSTNRDTYELAEFWDYPTDLPVSSMNWYYRGLALN